MISSLDTKPSLTSNINISVHKCCQDGNFELLKELVQNGSHINARDEFSSSPLHYAALNGYLNIVKYLIGGKAFKNNKNSSGHTPFLCASMNGHLDVVKYLVEEKVFTFAVDDSGNSALHLAAQNGHNELIKWLLENNIVDPSIKNRCGQTYQDILFPPSSSKSPSDSRIPSALHLTYLPCRIDGLTHSVDVAVSIPTLTWETLCMLVLKACLPNFEMITATESSLVDYAILLEEDGDEGSGKIDDMRKFMKVFTKIYKQNSRMTFLFFLVKEHDRLITVNSAPITQNIPIESSMVNKINEESDYLNDELELEHDPQSIDQLNLNSKSVEIISSDDLCSACSKGDFFRANELVSNGFNVNNRDSAFKTPLHYASEIGHLQLCSMLISNNAFKNGKDRNGRTPLLCASLHGHLEVVQYLIQVGCFTFVVDDESNGILHLAALSNNIALVNWIKDHCDIEQDLVNSDGKTYRELLAFEVQSSTNTDHPVELDEVDVKPDSSLPHPTTSLESIQSSSTDTDDDTTQPLSLISQQSTEALLNACFSGDFAVALRLLPMSDINCQHQSSLTPLHFSCHLGNLEFAEALLRAGANPNLQDRKGMTPLHYCCQNRDARLINLLFRFGAVFVSDDRGYSPLHLAAIAGDEEMFRLLTTHGGNIDEIDNLGNSPFFYLVEGKHIDLASWVVINFSPNIYLTNLDNQTPIDIARNFGLVEFCTLAVTNHQKRELQDRITSNTTKLADYLLNNDWNKATEILSRPIDPNLMIHGTYLLHICCQVNCETILKSIIGAGANVNLQDSEFMSPLMCASKLGYLSLVATLIENHADIFLQDRRGWTALFYAVAGNHLAIAKVLYGISKSLDTDQEGNTILHIACANHSMDCIHWLVSDLGLILSDETLNNAGETALGIARKKNFLEILSLSDKQLESLRIENTASFAQALKVHDLDQALSLCLSPSGVNPNELDRGSGKIMFHLACELGNLEIVKVLLDQGASITLESPNGRNAMDTACRAGQLEIIRWLKKIGSSLEKFSSEGLSPFHYACRSGNLSTVRWLIDRGVLPSINAVDSSSALHFACASGNKELVAYLISEHHIDPLRKNASGLLPIDFAAMEGSVEVVLWLSRNMTLSDHVLITLKSKAATVRKQKLILEHQDKIRDGALTGDISKIQSALEFGINIDSTGEDGTNVLHLACSGNKIDVIKFLIEKGANVNSETNEGLTPLHIAASKGHTEIFEYLLSHGANYATLDKDGNDILIHSTTSKTPDLAKMIISQFPNFNECRRNRLGVSAIVSAASFGNYDLAVWFAKNSFVKRQKERFFETLVSGDADTIEDFLESDIDLNIVDEHGLSPLHILSSSGLYTLVQKAIQLGANENALDKKFRTPLHLAAEQGHTEIVKYLSDMRAKLEAIDDFGMTPILYACKGGHILTIAYLVGQGAKITTTDAEDSNALHFACESGDLSLVKWLCDGFEISEDQTNVFFKTPRDVAYELGYEEIFSFLDERKKLRELENLRIQRELQEAERERQRLAAELEAKRQEELSREHQLEIERLKRIAEENEIECRANELLQAVATQQLLEFSRLGRCHEIIELLHGTINVNCHDSQNWTPLHFACQNKSLEIVKALIEAGANVNSVTLQNETPLLIAMKYHGSDSNLFWCLFSNGAHLDILSKENMTPLHYICEAGNYQLWNEIFNTQLSLSPGLLEDLLRHCAKVNQISILTALLKMNIDPDTKDVTGKTSLHLACEGGWKEIALTLLNAGATIDATDETGRTPLMYSILSNRFDMVLMLVDNHASLFHVDEHGNTPLHYASRMGNLKMATLLIQRGADIYSENEDGKTAYDLSLQIDKSLAHFIRSIIQKTTELLDICANGDNEGLILLMSKKYDITYRDKDRVSGLHLAAQNGHIDICRTLLKARLHVDTSDRHGRTPLSYACSNGHFKLAQFLCENGADLHHVSSDSRSYLHWATLSNSAVLLQWLLQFCSNCNTTADDNFTPLHDAAAHNCVSSIEILLERGASVTCRTLSGLTPFCVACQNNNYDAAKALWVKPYCSDIDSRDNAGRTSFLQACIDNRMEMVEWLYLLGANYWISTDNGDTALHIAVRTKNTHLVEWLALKGLDHFAMNDVGETPVDIASKCGNIQLAEWLTSQPSDSLSRCNSLIRELEISLEKSNVSLIRTLFEKVRSLLKPNMIGKYSLTTLCCSAAALNEADEVDVFINNGADISANSAISGMTALHYACKLGHLSMVHHLVAKGAALNIQDLKGRTPLDISILYQQTHVVDVLRLLEASSNASGGSNTPKFEDTIEITSHPFLHACITENFSQLKSMLDSSLDFSNIRSKNSGLTPLHVCVIYKPNEEIIGYLLSHGADPNLVDSNEMTPLHYACELQRDPTLIISLIKFKASLTLLSSHGVSALHIICKNDMVETMNFILDLPRSILKNLNLNVLDKSNRNLLHVTADIGSLSMCNLLIRQGISVNHLDQDSFTPLHIAVSRNQYDITKTLLENGADPNIKDKYGRTPISISIIDLKDLNTARLLHQFGATINILSEDGDTFLHIACRNGNVELAKWLVRSGLNPSTENDLGKSPVELAHLCGKDDLLEWLLAWIVATKVDRPVELILAEAAGSPPLPCEVPEESNEGKKQNIDFNRTDMETLHGAPLPTISTRSKSHPLDISNGRSNRQIALL